MKRYCLDYTVIYAENIITGPIYLCFMIFLLLIEPTLTTCNALNHGAYWGERLPPAPNQGRRKHRKTGGGALARKGTFR